MDQPNQPAEIQTRTSFVKDRKTWQKPQATTVDVFEVTQINAGPGADGINCHS